MTARLVIADAHPGLVAGLERLLVPEFDVVAVAHDAHALMAAVREYRPDVVLHGPSLPVTEADEVIREMRDIHPLLKVVVVTTSDDPNVPSRGFRAGASVYVLKHGGISDVRTAIAYALESGQGSPPLAPHRMVHVLTQTRSAGAWQVYITPRQQDMMQLLTEGKSLKEAAAIMNVPARTAASTETSYAPQRRQR